MSVKLCAALGFCARAGKLISGDFAVTKAVHSGTAKAVIVDFCASTATLKKWKNSCEYYNIDLFITDSPGKFSGKPEKIVFAVADAGFYEMIKKAYENDMQSRSDIKDTNINTGGN